MNVHAYSSQKNGSFIVRNITPTNNKTIKLFNYPILFNKTRDLLQIPGITESDIRASLLKGELRNKILAKDIVIESSDIDLIQFNIEQKAFLQTVGVVDGLEIGTIQITTELNDKVNAGGYGSGGGSTTFAFLFKQNMPVSGVLNGSNRLFTISQKFLNGDISGNTFKIKVYYNGQLLVEGVDYIVQESVSAMGYDTIFFSSFAPAINSSILTDYVIDNNQVLTAEQVTTRSLITFISEGPAEGYVNGAYKEILPAKSEFPTTITWWTSSDKLKKIVQLNLTYDINQFVIAEEWIGYDSNGLPLSSIKDTITYDQGIEISRIRTINAG